MKAYLLKLYKSFLNSKLITKIFVILSLIIYAAILSITLIKVEYEVIMPGGLTPVSDYINIDTDKKMGEVYTVSVYTKREISLFQKWIGKLNPHLDLEKYDPKNVLTNEEDIKQGEIYRNLSIKYSVIVAYTEAMKNNPNVNITYEFTGAVIYHKFKNTPKELSLGDTITKVNGEPVTIDNYEKILLRNSPIDTDTCNVNQKEITLTVIKEGERDETDIIVNDNCNKKYLIEAFLLPDFNIKEATPKFNQKKINNLGPSGGLMQTLGIYNALVDEDVTKGYRIVGTGTINLNGTSGIIGGVKQKIITAQLIDLLYNYPIDIFFVTADNFKEAKYIYERLPNPSFELIEVNSFSAVLEHLNKKVAKK